MRALGMLGTLIILAVPFVMFALGRMSANRRPGENHQAMAIFMAKLLAADNLTAILTTEQQKEAQRLVDEFTHDTTSNNQT